MTDDNNTPDNLYPLDPNRPEPVAYEPEDDPTVTISQKELDELGEFLGALRQVVLGLENRVSFIEAFLASVYGGGDEVDSDKSEGTDSDRKDGQPSKTIVDGSGNALKPGGTDVPQQDA